MDCHVGHVGHDYPERINRVASEAVPTVQGGVNEVVGQKRAPSRHMQREIDLQPEVDQEEQMPQR
jgi:hypothetical protein